jgi:hypothetical protein
MNMNDVASVSQDSNSKGNACVTWQKRENIVISASDANQCKWATNYKSAQQK